MQRRWFGDSNQSHGGGGFGAISNVKPDGNKVHLEFAAVKVKVERCTKEIKTNRIETIRDNGNVVYERQCLSSQTSTINSVPTAAC